MLNCLALHIRHYEVYSVLKIVNKYCRYSSFVLMYCIFCLPSRNSYIEIRFRIKAFQEPLSEPLGTNRRSQFAHRHAVFRTVFHLDLYDSVTCKKRPITHTYPLIINTRRLATCLSATYGFLSGIVVNTGTCFISAISSIY